MTNKTNSKNSKKRSNSSKLFIGTLIVIATLLVVSLYGGQLNLTGKVTGIATGYNFTSFFGDDDVDNRPDTIYNRTATAPAYNGNLAPTKKIRTIAPTKLNTSGRYHGRILVTEFVNLAGSADYSSSLDQYVLRTPKAWYSLTFSPGLPACLDPTTPFNACTADNRLGYGGVKLRFLGIDYLITNIEMQNNVWHSLTLSNSTLNRTIRLVQNTTINEVVFGKWQVSFTTANMSSTGSQSITRIQLGNDFQPSTLLPGEELDIMTGAPGYRWNFQGLNLVTADYTTLKVEPVNLDSIQVNGNTTSCSFSAVKLTSSRPDAFRFGSEQESTVWWLAKNRSQNGCGTWNGYWLYQNSSSVYANSIGLTTVRRDLGITSSIRFYYPGSGTDSSVNINITADGNFNNTRNGNTKWVNIIIPEILNESTVITEGSWNIAMVFGAGSAAGSASATDLGIRDSLGLTTSGKINYTAPGRVAADQTAAYYGYPPFYSPRGSFVSSAPTSTGYTIRYASKLGMAQYRLTRVTTD